MRSYSKQPRYFNKGWTKQGPSYDPFIVILDTPPNSPPRRGKNRVYNLPSQIISSQPAKRTFNTGWNKNKPPWTPFIPPRRVNSGWAPAKKPFIPSKQYFRKQPTRAPPTFKQKGFTKPFKPWYHPKPTIQTNWWKTKPKPMVPVSVKKRQMKNKFTKKPAPKKTFKPYHGPGPIYQSKDRDYTHVDQDMYED